MKQSTYFSIIPSGVLTNEIISDASKITYALILGLSNQYGYCFATNEALADMRRTSESSIKRHLKELIDNKCIVAEYNKRNDRRITPNIMPSSREKVLRNQNIVQYAISSDEVDQALDQVWKSINIPGKKKSK
jgi:DNA-binding MarR family transcriptional regulator